jgi:hypothetical protein
MQELGESKRLIRLPEIGLEPTTRALRMLICHFLVPRNKAKLLNILDCAGPSRPVPATVSAQKPAH